MMFAVLVLLLATISVELLDTIINALSQQLPSLGGLLHQGMNLITDLLGFVFTAALFFLCTDFPLLAR